MVTRSTLMGWVDDLRAECPPPPRTRVEVRYMAPDDPYLEGHRGVCSKHRQIFTIAIASGMSHSETCDVLAHEWAHMRAWTYRGIDDDHGDHFGIEWAKAHRALHHTR